jgi:hypothetical protein
MSSALRHILPILAFVLLANNSPAEIDSGMIDLLSLVDPPRDRLKGEVEVTPMGITMKSHWFISAVRLPYLPSAQYDLELELNRTQGKDGIGLVLPLAHRRQVTLVLGGYPNLGGLDGLNYINDKDLSENGTGKKSCLENKQKTSLTVHVRHDTISYRYPCRSGEQSFVHDLTAGNLSIDDRAGDLRQRSLGLYQVKGESHFTKIHLRDHGEGEIILDWQEHRQNP